MKAKHFILLFIALLLLHYIAWAIKFETMNFYLWNINNEWILFHVTMLLGYGLFICIVKMIEIGFRKD